MVDVREVAITSVNEEKVGQEKTERVTHVNSSEMCLNTNLFGVRFTFGKY